MMLTRAMKVLGRVANHRTVLALAAAVSAHTALGEPSVAHFSQAQADLGARVAERYCAKCHDPSYFEGSIYTALQGQPVAYLLDPIRATMPQDRPGSLKARHTAALIAWIMSLNGIAPSGAELPEDYERLASMILPEV